MLTTKEELHDLRIQQGKKLREIADTLGCSQSYVCILLKRYQIKKEQRVRVNERFGRLKVLATNTGKDKHSHAQCECLCDCGTTIVALHNSLLSGNTRSCGCIRPNQSPEHAFIPKFVWKSIRQGAQTRNLSFEITIEEIGKIFTGACALSGEDIWFGEDHPDTTASLDRIDSSQGYVIDNVQWLHKNVNTMKWDLTTERLLELCQKITVNHGKSNAQRP